MKNKKFKYIIIGIIVFIILLGFTPYVINDDRELNFIEKALKDTGVCIQKVFYAPIKFTKERIIIMGETKNLYNKYLKLKEKEEKTELYYAQIQELQKEVTELKSTLELNATLSEYTYVNATVINRNIGYWYNSLGIDKGSKNGIKKGDAVITPLGIIGKIINVSNFSSTVKLLTTGEISNKISVKINSENGYSYGFLTGYDVDTNTYNIEGITDSNLVSEESIVTTTGLTDYFPSGILIGTVSKIEKDEFDLNAVVKVIPSVDFKNISTVTVLNRRANE